MENLDLYARRFLEFIRTIERSQRSTLAEATR